MLEEQLKEMMEAFGLTDERAITFAHPKMETRWALPLPGVTVTSFQAFQPFFLYFDTEGVSFFPTDDQGYAIGKSFLPWKDVEEFYFKKGMLVENEISFRTADFTIEMKIPKTKAKNPWVKENNSYLSEHNFFKGDSPL